MKIALDFDSVLSDTMVSWTEKYNLKHGTKLTKKDIHSWSFWDDIGIERKYAMIFFNESWTDWTNLPPTEDDLASKVDNLSEYGTVDVVTEIDDSHLIGVKKWLDRNGISVNEVKHGEGRKISQPYDLFIDDSPDLAEQANKNNKTCFVYDQQWNRSVRNSEKITRINNLTEAIHKIANKEL